jgi:hypothetical protein
VIRAVGGLYPSLPNTRLSLSSRPIWNRPLPIDKLVFVVADGLLLDQVGERALQWLIEMLAQKPFDNGDPIDQGLCGVEFVMPGVVRSQVCKFLVCASKQSVDPRDRFRRKNSENILMLMSAESLDTLSRSQSGCPIRFLNQSCRSRKVVRRQSRCGMWWLRNAFFCAAVSSMRPFQPSASVARRFVSLGRTVETPPDHRALSGSDLVRGDTANGACMTGHLQSVTTVAGAPFCRDRRHLRPGLTFE